MLGTEIWLYYSILKVDRIHRKSGNKDKDDTKNIVKGAEHLGDGGGVQLDIEDCCNMAMCDTVILILKTK